MERRVPVADYRAAWPRNQSHMVHNAKLNIMTFLRLLIWLSLIVWLGGLIFFGSVLAPTVFSVLPTRHLAGAVVNRSLGALHWMGMVSAVVFLGASMLHSRLGGTRVFGLRHVLVCLMLTLTLISQFGIMPKMAELRAGMGEIDNVAPSEPARLQFDGLHAWSTRLEGVVLLLGVVVVYLTAAGS